MCAFLLSARGHRAEIAVCSSRSIASCRLSPYSRSLESVATARTRLERDFGPGSVREMKAQSERDITVGGPELAAEAIRAALVDEIHLIISPVVVGGGTRALPGAVRLQLELLDEHRFASGVIHLRYRVVNQERTP